MLTTWKQTAPGELRLPLPLEVLWAGFVACIADDQLFMGAALLIGFFGMLRPGELLALRRSDVKLPADFPWRTYGERAILAIRKPKTAKTAGRIQHVVLDEVDAVRWLEWVCSQRQQVLFEFNERDFARLFQQVLHRVRITSIKFTPASLRAGGATHEFLAHGDIAKLRWRGRWQAVKTMDHYVQEIAAALVTTRLPDATRQLIQQLLQFKDQCVAPPNPARNLVAEDGVVPRRQGKFQHRGGAAKRGYSAVGFRRW